MFRVGDEVVCVAMTEEPAMVGRTYTIREVRRKGQIGTSRPLNSDAVQLVEVPYIQELGVWGYVARNFRKVQKRDLTEWLSQSVKNTDKLDRPRKVRVS